MAVLGILASVGIGLSLGLVGAGGSILTVPILVYLLGVSPHDAIGVSLAVVAATSLVGAFLQGRAGLVDLRAALLFGSLGTAAAWAGSHLTHLMTARHLMGLFGAVMLLAAAAMMRLPTRAAPRAPSLPKAAIAALASGLLTGFLGVGGGFLAVPALIFFAGLPARIAMGTSLAVIAANSLVGLIASLKHGAIDGTLAATLSAASVAGMTAGASLSRKLSPRTLRRGFALVAIALGVYVLGRTVTSADEATTGDVPPGAAAAIPALDPLAPPRCSSEEWRHAASSSD